VLAHPLAVVHVPEKEKLATPDVPERNSWFKRAILEKQI
jgi:hypothetical protein